MPLRLVTTKPHLISHISSHGSPHLTVRPISRCASSHGSPRLRSQISYLIFHLTVRHISRCASSHGAPHLTVRLISRCASSHGAPHLTVQISDLISHISYFISRSATSHGELRLTSHILYLISHGELPLHRAHRNNTVYQSTTSITIPNKTTQQSKSNTHSVLSASYVVYFISHPVSQLALFFLPQTLETEQCSRKRP